MWRENIKIDALVQSLTMTDEIHLKIDEAIMVTDAIAFSALLGFGYSAKTWMQGSEQ